MMMTMIKANELRIGNWYKGVSRDILLKADGRMIAQLQEGVLIAQPIPLTEEILLKCGFEKDGPFFDLAMFTLRNFKDEWIVYHFKRELIRINYLHHLQNIYWCLCVKELEVNL